MEHREQTVPLHRTADKFTQTEIRMPSYRRPGLAVKCTRSVRHYSDRHQSLLTRIKGREQYMGPHLGYGYEQ